MIRSGRCPSRYPVITWMLIATIGLVFLVPGQPKPDELGAAVCGNSH